MKFQVKMNKFIADSRFNFKYLSIFLVAFLIGKLSLILGPLLFSNILDREQYAIFEYALSIGLTLAIFFSFGTNYSLPAFNLRENELNADVAVYIHTVFATTLIGILSSIIFFLGLLPVKIFIGLLFGIIYTLQKIVSVTFLTRGDSIRGTLLNSGFLTVIVLTLVIKLIFKNSETIPLLITSISIYSLVLYTAIIRWVFILGVNNLVTKYKKVIEFGFRSLLFILLWMMVFHSGKVLTDYFLGEKFVAYFSIFYRSASIIVIFEKMLEQFFFKQLYTKSLNTISYMFNYYFGILLLFSFGWYLVSPIFLGRFFTLFSEAYIEFNEVYLVFCLQMILWSSITISQRLILRDTIKYKFILSYLLILLLLTSSFYIADHFGKLNFPFLTLLYTAGLYLASELQLRTISKRNNIKFTGTRIITSATIIIVIITQLI